MKYIELHNRYTSERILINILYITAVECDGEQAVVDTPHTAYIVQESYEQVIDKLRWLDNSMDIKR